MLRLVRFACEFRSREPCDCGNSGRSCVPPSCFGGFDERSAYGVTFTSAINERGEIVGQSFNDQFQSRAFLWATHHRDG